MFIQPLADVLVVEPVEDVVDEAIDVVPGIAVVDGSDIDKEAVLVVATVTASVDSVTVVSVKEVVADNGSHG